MKRTLSRVFSLCLALLMVFVLLPELPARAAEDNYLHQVDITYDADHAFPTTRMTGALVSQTLFPSITCPKVGNYDNYTDPFYVYGGSDYVSSWCALHRKQEGKNSGTIWEDFENLYDSNEFLNSEDEYYFGFDVYALGGKTIDPENLPTVTVNGSTGAIVRYSQNDEIVVFFPVALNETAETAWSITMDTTSVAVQKGKTHQFSATVEGMTNAVTWTVTGNNKTGTKVDSTGKLTVASTETAETLTVRAAAAANPNLYREVTVLVTAEAPHIDSVTFTATDHHCSKSAGLSLFVTVQGTDAPDVTWTLDGAASVNTYLENKGISNEAERESRGYLFIGRDETASTLTVRATSAADPTKYAETVVTVDPLQNIITSMEILYDAAAIPLDTAHTGAEVSAALFGSIQSPKAVNYTSSDPWYIHGSDEYTSSWCSLWRKEEGCNSGDIWEGYYNLYDSEELLSPAYEYYFVLDVYGVNGNFDPNALPVVTANGRTAEARYYKENEVEVFIPVYLNGSTPLSITSQPVDCIVNAIGDTATFTVVAEGEGLTYQWWIKNPGAAEFTKSSIKKATYSTPVTETSNGRQLYCVVTDKYGKTVTTNTVTMRVKTPLKITTQPTSQTVAKAGDTATTTVVAEGDGLTYQWYIKNVGDSAFKASAIKKATYSTTVTEACNGRQLYCVVKDKYGNQVKSSTVTFTIASAGPKITTQPSNQTVAEGATATFKVVASGTGLKYQWQYKTSSTASWKNSSSATTGYNTATLKVVGTTERNGFQYRCKVTDSNGNTVISNAVTLTVSSGPKITTQPTNQTVAEGATATFKVVASGTGLKYQWQYKTSSTASWKNSSSATTGYNTATLKVVGTAERNGFQYRCKVTDGSGNSVTSNTATLTVTTGPKITTQPKSVVVAKAGDTATATVVAAGEGLTYQWYIKNVGDSAFKASAIKKATYSTTVTEACNGRQLYCIVKDKNGKTVQSDTITFTIAAALKITRQPVNAYVKAIGDTAKITVKAEGEGLTYTWYYKNPGASTFTKSAITKSTYSTTVTSTSNGRQLYCVVKDKNGNEVKSDTVTMSKATGLAIITQPEDVSAANGAAVSVAIEAYGTGLTYQWYFKDAGNSSFSKSSIKTATYTTTMNADRNGRQIYCVVKDSASNTVKTITVTLTMK